MAPVEKCMAAGGEVHGTFPAGDTAGKVGGVDHLVEEQGEDLFTRAPQVVVVEGEYLGGTVAWRLFIDEVA
jgi:hypothetical protein